MQIVNLKKPDSNQDLEQNEGINFWNSENMCYEFNALR
jgi:hypothetical protein